MAGGVCSPGEPKYSRVFLESDTIETLRGICAVININSPLCDLTSNRKRRRTAAATRRAVGLEKLSRAASYTFLARKKVGSGRDRAGRAGGRGREAEGEFMVFRKRDGGIGMETFYGTLLTKFGEVTRRSRIGCRCSCWKTSANPAELLPLRWERGEKSFAETHPRRGGGGARALVERDQTARAARTGIFFCHGIW